ncbi:eosinophil peroxidase isoform 2-T2 [Spinachia spinachia]
MDAAFMMSGSWLGLALVLLSCPDDASLNRVSDNTSGAVYPGSGFVEEALRRAIELTDAAYARTSERVKKPEGALRPSDLLAQFKQTEAKTSAQIRAAELLDNTVELIREMVYTHTMVQPDHQALLSERDMENLQQVTGCSAELQRPSCDTDCLSERYRSITGECNNRHNPRWGAANIPYSRWLPAEYEDLWGMPRGWDPQHTYHNASLPPIPLSDPRSGFQSCMPFFRSAPSCVAGVPTHRRREQLNAITSFVDASMVYGSSASLASILRNSSSPLGSMTLNSQHSDRDLAYMPYLPKRQAHLDPCGPRSPLPWRASNKSRERDNATSCFQAGDSRANEHLGMIALHTLFLREHNRLVKELHLINPRWSPDTLYQEARKIMGAVHQILTWEHYLPRVLGEGAMSRLMPPYKGYDPEVDPSIANVFAAAAFRFAHVTVQPVVTRLGPGYTPNSQHPQLPLHHSLFASWRVVQEGGIDPVLRGLLLSPAKLQTPGQMMVEELTERLFQAQGGMPLDLGALNLQRGRDHGLPGYGSWRRSCSLSVPNTTSELAEILSNFTLAHKLQLLYGTPHNIDVWVGAISEPALPGGRVGPLLSCLLARQFRALRDGDRFWWEREGVFTATQRRRLHAVSLSRIICDNSHITRVPADPFSRTERPEDMLSCSHPLISPLDLGPWKEPDEGENVDHRAARGQLGPTCPLALTDPGCGLIPRIPSGYSLLCDSVVLYQCPSGFELLGSSSVSCDPSSRQWSPSAPTCQDVDECKDQTSACPQHLECFNTPGSFICSEPSSLSVVSVVTAVVVVTGGVAALLMIMFCCRRYFSKKEELVNAGCCQEKS